MNKADLEYFRLADDVLRYGRKKNNRTGVDTIGIFGAQARFNFSEGFPLLTTKKVFHKGIIHELLWFLKGDTNIKYLVDNDVHIWDDNCYDKYLKNHNKKFSHEINGVRFLDVCPMDKKSFIDGIKNNIVPNDYSELGEGTYGGMWRAFPYYSSEDFDAQMKSPLIGDFPMKTISFLKTVDQIQKIVEKLKNNPDDRRMIVSAWHPYWVDHCALPPCHCLFQFHTEELTEYERNTIYLQRLFEKDGYGVGGETPVEIMDAAGIPKRRLNCQLYQRSCDLFLGVPFNIASYALLTSMVAHVTNMVPGDFVHTFGDLHLYKNSLEAIRLQMTREPMPAPTLWLNPEVKNIFDFKYEDIRVENYESHPAIRGVAMAV